MMQTSAVPTFIPVNRQLDKPLELAMQSLTLTGEVTPVGARLQVHHLFRNGEEDPVEVVYAFALPRDGALREFRIHGEGFSVTSDLVPAKEAQQHYAQAIRKGHLGALVTQHADGLVNLYLGNLRPGETVAVFLELLAGVESLDKGFRFRFPFTLSPVYHAGGQFRQVAPGVGTMEFPNDPAAPLLPRWVAAAEGLHWVACNLHLRLAAPQVEVRSPSHCISVRAQQGGFVEVSLAQGHDLPNRDLILEVEHPRPVTWTACARDSGGKSHVAALLPSTFFGHRREPEARKVVFLLDRSGSMRGVNLMGAKRALARLLTLLREQDVFSVVVFETAAEACFTELLPASEANVELARSFLEAVEAKGGTELGAGLQLAAEVAGSGADLLLLTDGQVGSTDEILDLARRLNLRLWVLGIGSASQDRFLNLLARETGGQSYFLTAGEDLEQAAEQLFGTVFGVLTESLEVVAEGVDLRPVPSPRVFCGRPTILCGEFSGSDPKSVLLRWSHGGQRREEQLTLTPQDDPVLAETLAMVRGARLLTDLDARWSEGGDAAERRQQEHLRGAMEYLSRRYGLASRVMALVGVVERAGDRPGEVPAVRIVPVGMPQDTAFSAYFGDFGEHYDGVTLTHLRWRSRCEGIALRVIAPDVIRPEPEKHYTLGQLPWSAAAENPEDFLATVGFLLHTDGGLPGETLYQRWLNTLYLSIFLLMALATQRARLENVRAHLAKLVVFTLRQRLWVENLHPRWQKALRGLSKTLRNGDGGPLLDESVSATLRQAATKVAKVHPTLAYQVVHQLVFTNRL